ncbi:MAG: dTMP kinase [Clostridiales bacterium]|nr:dTMP kinase [Clostridiales bacterium]
MSKGLFITFEGIDGCGKSTQLELLKEDFRKEGLDFIEVREPGGTAVGEKIRNILLDRQNDSMTRMAELLLFEAARAQITEEVIIPALESGKHVICDRFYDSTSAYQGYANKMGRDLTDFLNVKATSGVSPDLTFLLDIDPRTAYERRTGRDGEEDRIEMMGLSYQEKVREGYIELSKEEDKRIRVIDATKTREQIYAEIKGQVWDLIS